jgi:predicted protein tyrosine phosphatase
MSAIVVCPLGSIAELAVRHKASHLVSLIAERQDFHRPGLIQAERHLTLKMNDIAFAGTGDLVAPTEEHVERLVAFVRQWDRAAPIVIHCWMGVSRSPAAAVIASLAVDPDEDDVSLAQRLRAAAPHATPNARLIEFGDQLLGRKGRLIAAIKGIGRGSDADGKASFVLPLWNQVAKQ